MGAAENRAVHTRWQEDENRHELSPMLDDRPAFKADPDAKHRRLLGQGMNRLGWESYLRAVTQTMRFRREPEILVVGRRRGSALALLICSPMSASSMPIDSNKAACNAHWKLSPTCSAKCPTRSAGRRSSMTSATPYSARKPRSTKKFGG